MNLATKRGDSADFGRDVLPLQPNLMRVAMGLTRNPAEASDLVQDALERALREWDRFTPGTNARAWVTAILSRLFIDGWRRRRRRPTLVSLDDLDVPSGPLSPETDPAPAPWDSISDADLDRAIAALPEPLRDVFRLNVVDHLSYGAIGATLGIPINTVGTRLMRARRRLRASLEATTAAAPVSFLVPQPVPHTCARAAFLTPRRDAAEVEQSAQSARRSISARASAAQGAAPVSRPM